MSRFIRRFALAGLSLAVALIRVPNYERMADFWHPILHPVSFSQQAREVPSELKDYRVLENICAKPQVLELAGEKITVVEYSINGDSVPDIAEVYDGDVSSFFLGRPFLYLISGPSKILAIEDPAKDGLNGNETVRMYNLRESPVKRSEGFWI